MSRDVIIQQMEDVLRAGDALYRHSEKPEAITEVIAQALNRLWAYYVMSESDGWRQMGPERSTLATTCLWNNLAMATRGRFLCMHGPSINVDGYPMDCDIVWTPPFCAHDVVIRLRPEKVWPGEVKRPAARGGARE